ncbi:MAG: hypothetical protein DRM98_06420, partial [Thermoplasmata archaeon]
PEYFKGIIDEVRIYATALPSDVIAEHYHGYYSEDNLYDLRAVYHFNEGTGNTASDSKNGNDATLYNGAQWTTDIPEIPWS